MNGLKKDLEELWLIQAFLEKNKIYLREVLRLGMCLPFTLLEAASRIMQKGTLMGLGAQDCHASLGGAFTGSISAPMLKDLGVKYVLLGHGERRLGCQESDEQISHKLHAAHACGLFTVLCVGETLREREAGETHQRLRSQLSILDFKTHHRQELLAIAYEPLWCIGTGLTPTHSDIVQVVGDIHGIMSTKTQTPSTTSFASLIATPVLYGGSVSEKNIKEIMALPAIGGTLIGGASLRAKNMKACLELLMQDRVAMPVS